MLENILHIAISSDSNYLEYAMVLVKSVIDSNKEHFDGISIHFLANSISLNDLAPLSDLIKANGCSLEVYDLSDIRNMLGISVPDTISVSAYARLFLSSIIRPSIDRILYMDVDAVNIRPLSELWKIDMSQSSVAGVLDDVDLRAKTNIGLNADSPYINSGFVLINLDYWRQHHIQERFIEFLKQHDGNVFHHDQGIINAVCNSSLKILPPEYNVMTNFYLRKYESYNQLPFYTKDEIELAKVLPVFIHFTPGVVNRPWCRNCKHPMFQAYREARAKVGLYDDSLKPDNRPFRVKMLSQMFFYAYPMYCFTLWLRSKLRSKKI